MATYSLRMARGTFTRSASRFDAQVYILQSKHIIILYIVLYIFSRLD